MHHIYQTRGFVLGSNVFGEANCSFKVFTKDLGLIKVTAQGVRLLKSKLRYSIHDYSCCDISLVRGKEMWRVTGASKHFDLYREFSGNSLIFQLFVRVFSLLERLLPGEEKNEILFNYVDESVNYAKNNSLNGEMARNFEYILVLRILFSLGYLGSSPDTSSFIESPYWSEDLLKKMSESNQKILVEINKSLKESQL